MGDMPKFLDQNRPAKVKEIYRALKRDHPDMPAEMKARIASRRGKKNAMSRKSPKDGGPKYKAPITAKYKAAQASLQKCASDLRNDIVNRATACGEAMEKTAAEQYFHDLRKLDQDVDMLGAKFCKLAHGIGRDPWELALEVADHFPAYAMLSKTASDPKARELAEFYLDWSDEMEKSAFIGKGLSMLGAGAKQLGRNIKGMSSSGKMPQAVSGAPKKRGVMSAMKRQGKDYSKVQAQGGGSYGRGQQMIKQRQGEIAATKASKAAPAQGTALATTPATTPQPGAIRQGLSTAAKTAIGGTAVAGAVGVPGYAYLKHQQSKQQAQQPQQGYYR